MHLERQVEEYKMKEKKVIAFIVEGPSDETALGSIMKEYFSNHEVQFVVVHGDITLKDYVTIDKIKVKISDTINEIKKKYRYCDSDFIKIIHIVDTDGVFIPDENVKEENVEKVQYGTCFIETKNVKGIVDRNQRKRLILSKLRKEGKVRGIPYRIYYNSCNLEHVLYNELISLTDDEKRESSDEFADRYDGRVDEFIEFISGVNVAVAGTYQETWNFIEKDTNSLNRHTNMHLIFESKVK